LVRAGPVHTCRPTHKLTALSFLGNCIRAYRAAMEESGRPPVFRVHTKARPSVPALTARAQTHVHTYTNTRVEPEC
jgi:hypothetical protein